MLCLVGLGNPGAKYAGNRHNIGFMAVDAIARAHGFSAPRDKFNSEASEGVIQTENGPVKALLLKPKTFMNESGRAVSAALSFYKIDLDHLVVFHDELDLEAGKFRVKLGGGIAGHNGLRSIKQHSGNEFVRVRMGIGHPGHKDRVHSYVLSDFDKSEEGWVNDQCSALARALPLLASAPSSIAAMNAFQTKVNHLAPAPNARPQRVKGA